MNHPALLLALAASNGFLAVALGAFAAHGLKNQLSDYAVGIFNTAAHYQLIHAAALLAVVALLRSGSAPGLTQAAGYSFVLGTLIFSGSLYLLALTNLKWLGAITPVGGLAFLVGWACLVIAALRTL